MDSKKYSKLIFYSFSLILLVFFFFIGFNSQDILHVTYLITGDIVNYGHSFDYVVHSSMTTGLPFLLVPFAKIGIGMSVISKLISMMVSFTFLFGVYQIIKKKSESISFDSLLLSFFYCVAGFYIIPRYYTFELFRTNSSGGFVGTSVLFFALSLFFIKSRYSNLVGLFTFFLHPVLGAYYFISTSLVHILNRSKTLFLKSSLVASLCVPLYFILKYFFSIYLPPLDITLDDGQYFDILKAWDHHRVTVSYLSSEFIAVFLALLFSVFSICRGQKSRENYFLLCSSSLYIILIILYNHFFEFIPRELIIAMPQRFSLIPILIATLVLLKKLWHKDPSTSFLFLFCAIFLTCLPYIANIPFDSIAYFKVGLAVVFFGISTLDVRTKGEPFIKILALVASIVLFSLKYQSFIVPDLKTNKVDIGGNTLSCSVCSPVTLFYQLSNLLNFQEVDTIAYIPENAQYFSKIFKDIYTTEFYEENSGKEYRNYINLNYERKLWENRTLDNWRKISSKYNVKGVLVPKGWNLEFRFIELGDFKLYLIE